MKRFADLTMMMRDNGFYGGPFSNQLSLELL